ncbi:MAG: hypothetical protein JWP75_3473 [Frondihabitans sp.]|nr:hypothetical protein [Frondihabitans sp.]
MKRSTTAIAAAAVAVSLALAGCSSGGPSTGTGSTTSTVSNVTVATPAIATTFDWDAGGLYSNENFEAITNTQADLIRSPYVDGTQDYSKFEGVLATKKNPYTVSANKLTYTFNLRKGVKSQAGNPFTADDVMYSFERKYGSATSPAPSNYNLFLPDGLKSIKKIDDYHVSFTVKKASDGFPFLGLLANINGRIYDKTVLDAHATKADPYALQWAKVHTGWGYGAYTVTSLVPGQSMVLTANKNYVLGEPVIRKITFKQVTDPGTRVTLLQSGSVDFAEGLRPSDQTGLAGDSSITVPTVKNPIEFLDLVAVTKQAPFDNQTVREALTYAIPYAQILKQVYDGRAVKSQGLIIPSTKGYDTASLPEYGYDPTKAKALLAKAGKTGDVAFTLHVSSTVPDAVDAATLIKSYAAKAGFDVTIQTETAASFATGRSTAAYQALIFRTRAQTQSPVYMTASWFLPNDSPNNVPRWEDPAFYKLVDEARSFPNPLSTQAGKVWAKAIALEMKSGPETPIVYIQPAQAFSSKFTGYGYRTDNTFDFSILKPTS